MRKITVLLLSLLVVLCVLSGLNNNNIFCQAYVSSPTIANGWSTACQFTDASTSTSRPSMKLLVDNYAARSEARAILQRNPLAFDVALPMDFSTATRTSSSSPFCAGRFMWRGFIAPFYLTQVFGNVGTDAESISLPDISSLNTEDLDYFASCTKSVDHISIDPVRITISNLQVLGGSWNFSTANFTTTTQAADTPCNPDFSSSSSSLSQFVKLFAVAGNNVEQIVSSTSSGKTFEWVARGTTSDCPIYLGVAIDPSICPDTVIFSGSSIISFSVSLEVTTDPIISAAIWYMWVPSTACIFFGLVFLIIYIATHDKNKLPLDASPETTETSAILALSKIILVSGTIGSAIGLALTLIIDQNQTMLVGTPYSVLLMGALFLINAILVIAVAGVLAGKEDKRLKSMPIFIVAWLRLVSRALAIGATCAAWYRGFFVIGILYVVFQFFIEIGFWANVATTFAGSHEPIRFGVPGDQLLGMGFLSYLGLYFSPVLGVCASASSRIFCLTEMSERFQVRRQFDEVVSADDEDNDNEDTLEASPGKLKNKRNKKNSANKKKGSKNISSKKKENDDDDEDEQNELDQTIDEDGINEDELRHRIYKGFPVSYQTQLAAGFEGILSVRWWSLFLEVIGLVGLCCVIAHAHPPFVTYAVAQFFAAFGFFGAAFGAVTGQCGEGYGSSRKSGLMAVLHGDPRPTVAAISKIPFGSLYAAEEMENKRRRQQQLVEEHDMLLAGEEHHNSHPDGGEEMTDLMMMSDHQARGLYDEEDGTQKQHNKTFHPPPVKPPQHHQQQQHQPQQQQQTQQQQQRADPYRLTTSRSSGNYGAQNQQQQQQPSSTSIVPPPLAQAKSQPVFSPEDVRQEINSSRSLLNKQQQQQQQKTSSSSNRGTPTVNSNNNVNPQRPGSRPLSSLYDEDSTQNNNNKPSPKPTPTASSTTFNNPPPPPLPQSHQTSSAPVSARPSTQQQQQQQPASRNIPTTTSNAPNANNNRSLGGAGNVNTGRNAPPPPSSSMQAPTTNHGNNSGLVATPANNLDDINARIRALTSMSHFYGEEE